MKKNKRVPTWRKIAEKLHLCKTPKYHKPTKIGRPTFYEKVCPTCGIQFSTIRPRQKYHSEECRPKWKCVPTDDELISVIRDDYLNLCKSDPVQAQRIADEIEVIEGAEFREIALDGLVPFKKPNLRGHE